jgi:hypothetical protein
MPNDDRPSTPRAVCVLGRDDGAIDELDLNGCVVGEWVETPVQLQERLSGVGDRDSSLRRPPPSWLDTPNLPNLGEGQ